MPARFLTHKKKRHAWPAVIKPKRKGLARQDARLPITKCRIREITAKRSNKWIRPPATWNIVKPPIHAINRTTNKIVQMLIGLLLVALEESGAER